MDAEDVFLKAMQLELDGREFYRQAAQRSTDPQAAQLYRQLAEDEAHHYLCLRRQYEALRAGQGWAAIAELPPVRALDAAAPIFPAGKAALEVLPDNATEEEVLLFALTAEDRSYLLYVRQTRQARFGPERQFFMQLAAVELGHYHMLMAHYHARFSFAGRQT